VLREDYRQRRRITDQEIDFLREYGIEVTILNGHHEREIRAGRFAAFVRRYLRTH